MLEIGKKAAVFFNGGGFTVGEITALGSDGGKILMVYVEGCGWIDSKDAFPVWDDYFTEETAIELADMLLDVGECGLYFTLRNLDNNTNAETIFKGLIPALKGFKEELKKPPYTRAEPILHEYIDRFISWAEHGFPAAGGKA